MAGRGPAPKPTDQRARRNADPIPMRVLVVQPTEQPALPEIFQTINLDDGSVVQRPLVWPAMTRMWWAMWSESPLSNDFTASDWLFLLDTAMLHAQFWQGDMKLAAELRQRVAKFGATPEDRARLRITFAAADEADGGELPAAPRSARAMYRGLMSRGGPDAVAGA